MITQRQRDILHALNLSPYQESATFIAETHGLPLEDVQEDLQDLLAQGLIVGEDEYDITNAGIVALVDYCDIAVAVVEQAPTGSIQNIPMPPDEVVAAEVEADIVPHRLYQPVFTPYDGPELRRTCVRPGAYDAYDIPSLNNKRPSHVR